MDDRWLQVLGLVLIIEALLPFISPQGYRQAVLQMANTKDGTMRTVAFLLLALGAVLLMLSAH